MRRLLMLTLILGMLLLAGSAASAQVGGQPYVGEILLVAFNFEPNGWAFCDGRLMSISQNTALFSLLGTYYGGNGINTFALPDLRGRTPIGSGQAVTGTLYSLGQTGGEESVTLQVSQMPAHSHPVMGSTNVANAMSPSGAIWAAQSTLNIYSSTPDSSMAPGAVTLAPAGGSQPHDNRSPYLTLNYIISLFGIYPSRS